MDCVVRICENGFDDSFLFEQSSDDDLVSASHTNGQGGSIYRIIVLLHQAEWHCSLLKADKFNGSNQLVSMCLLIDPCEGLRG